jgi:hypothetical protein
MLDPKDWEIVLEVYKGHPIAALGLAQQFIAIKQSLERGRKGIPDAKKALEVAIETLFPHTEFHKMGHKFYRRTIEGKITPKQQEKQRRKMTGKK